MGVNMKSLKSVVIPLVLVVGIFCSNSLYGLSSPEAVIQNFISQMKNANIDAAINLSPFCVDRLVNKITPRENLLYINSLLPTDNLIFPSASIRKYELLGRYSTQIKFFVYSILLPEEFNQFINYMPMSNINENIINRFFSALNFQNLRSLEIVRFDRSNPEVQFSERGRSYNDNQKKIYGFDERVEYTVLYRLNGKYYVGGMTIVKYGNDWYLLSLNSMCANTPTSGAIELVPGIADYLANYGIRE